jgi:hypothetical protein
LIYSILLSSLYQKWLLKHELKKLVKAWVRTGYKEPYWINQHYCPNRAIAPSGWFLIAVAGTLVEYQKTLDLLQKRL